MEACEHRAELCQEIDRFADMILAVRPIIDSSTTALLPAHRNLIHEAYKGHVLALLKQYHRIEKQEGRTWREKYLLVDYLAHIREEVRKTSREILDFIDYKFLVFENSVEGVIFYQKIQGDYYRYMAEAGDSDSSMLSSQSYLKAMDRVSQLPSFHPTRLSLVLNYSVFHHDIKKDLREAIIIAKAGFDMAIKEVHVVEPRLYKEVMEYLDLIRDNVKIWKEERKAKIRTEAEIKVKQEIAQAAAMS